MNDEKPTLENGAKTIISPLELFGEFSQMQIKNIAQLAVKYNMTRQRCSQIINAMRLAQSVKVLLKVLLREVQADNIQSAEYQALNALMEFCDKNEVKVNENEV